MSKYIIKIAYILVFLVICSMRNAAIASINVVDISIQDRSISTIVTIKLDKKSKYNIFTLNKPSRLVVDIKDAKLKNELHSFNNHKKIKTIRYFYNNKTLRLVLENKENSLIKKSIIRKNGSGKYYEIIMVIENLVPILKNKIQPTKSTSTFIPIPVLKAKLAPIIIIDAGHGGEDSGAIGSTLKTYEKNITFRYATRLKNTLSDKKNKYNIYLTRDKDVYIPLEERVKISENKKADLFISLHADSHPDKNIRGLSVYTLSETASDKEAEKLAIDANSSGKIGDIILDEKLNSEITSLLLDMAQRDKKNRSSIFAELLVKDLKKNVNLLHNTHRFAGFRVLTSPSVPSVLIELGYMSNKDEENLLLNKTYEEKIISAIAKSIDSYFKQNTK